MSYVVEVFFDDKTDAAVRRLWDDLASLGIADSPANHGTRPHVSIASCQELDTTLFMRKITDIAVGTPTIPIEFQSVSAFLSTEGVVFLAPVVAIELLELHRSLIGIMKDCGGTVPAYYHSGHWVPHCTLATHLSGELLPRAITHCQQQLTPLNGFITEIGLVETSVTSSGKCEAVQLKNG